MEAPPPPPPPQPQSPLPLDKLFKNKRSRLSSLPEELQDDIKRRVRDLRARELSNQIVRAETLYAYPLFLDLVRRFIREAEQGELNPDAFYNPRSTSSMRAINNTCLQFVEIRCMRIVSKMYGLVDIRFPDRIPPELDLIREVMMQLAIQRNNKNKEALRTLRGNLSSVEELIYSIERVADLCYTVIKTSIRTDVTPLSEAALALSNECCDQFIMIIGNDDITPELKEEAKQLLFQMLRKLHNISQDRDNLSESVRAIGRMIHDKIKQQPWWPRYAQDHGYQQGGKISKSFKKQSKNGSNRRASKRKNDKNKNSRRKNKKIKKKTLRLRFNK
jgi:hypothetical protein